jgi:inosine-uridine nucleoside N-ribohydrolase
VARKVVIVADPGIDGAFALSLALLDDQLEVLAVAATAGNVDSARATENVHIVIEQIDPPRWPRVGAALPAEYDVDGKALHGATGLGSFSFPCAQLHHPHSSEKLIIDFVRQYPKEVTVVLLGPATVLARAIDRDPELPALVQRVICVGGAWHEPGDASAVAEFHFFCDPLAARQVLRSGLPTTLLPLDIVRSLLFSPTELLDLLRPENKTCSFLRKIVPFGFRATSNLLGIEGLHLYDLAGIMAVAMPSSLTTKPVGLDVETRGELTRGMCVVDVRPGSKAAPNADIAVTLDNSKAREYIRGILEK